MEIADVIEIIPMVAEHVDTVLRIERSVFRDAWTEEAFREALRLSDKCWTVKCAGEIAGYLITQWVLDEIHILNIAVAPEFQRKHIGSRILEHLFDKARRWGMRDLFLEVRISNFTAIALYERFGFGELAIRKNYYADGEDARVMHCALAGSGDESPDYQMIEKTGEREG